MNSCTILDDADMLDTPGCPSLLIPSYMLPTSTVAPFCDECGTTFGTYMRPLPNWPNVGPTQGHAPVRHSEAGGSRAESPPLTQLGRTGETRQSRQVA